MLQIQILPLEVSRLFGHKCDPLLTDVEADSPGRGNLPKGHKVSRQESWK